MTFHVLKENNNNYGTGLVETADYEEGSGRSRVWGGGKGGGGGERSWEGYGSPLNLNIHQN